MFAYYVIHNLEKKRYDNIVSLLKSNGVDSKEVTFINHPNKDELTYEIKKMQSRKTHK